MREFEVLFAGKTAGPSGHPEKIVTEIGSHNWRLKREAAIGWLSADAHSFYIKQGDQKVYLVAATHNDQSWLRTSADWTQPNTLLELPDLPAAHSRG
jgi:hypothetical protein